MIWANTHLSQMLESFYLLSTVQLSRSLESYCEDLPVVIVSMDNLQRLIRSTLSFAYHAIRKISRLSACYTRDIIRVGKCNGEAYRLQPYPIINPFHPLHNKTVDFNLRSRDDITAYISSALFESGEQEISRIRKGYGKRERRIACHALSPLYN